MHSMVKQNLINILNPLLQEFDTPFGVPPFELIEDHHYTPAIKSAIDIALQEVANIVEDEDTPTFENTIVALERAGSQLSRIKSIFFNLNSADTNEKMQEIAQEVSPLLSKYSSDILLNEALLNKIEQVYNEVDRQQLDAEDIRILDKTYKSFIRNGALLSVDKKEELRDIDRRLSLLSLTFGEHLLAETKEYSLVIDNEGDLSGLPEYTKVEATRAANERGLVGKWVITLDAPSYVSFVTYADNRELRKQATIAYIQRCAHANAYDNSAITVEIAHLRMQRAQLLGYPSHAHFILEERMAETPQQVNLFLQQLIDHGLNAGKRDISEVAAFAYKLDGIDDLQRWDYSYYAEKLKRERYSIDDELLKPYFQLDDVIQGAMEVAHKLYGIQFHRRRDIPAYHPDVTAYEVIDTDDSLIAILYTDFFPRPGKRNGAWMTSFRGQSHLDDENIRPIISIVCNFPKASEEQPSLLTFNDVRTLFHEFGHALHGMLANTKYESLSGTRVYWDFVELPSQVMENWCTEKECLDLFARHYQSGELIPDAYITKLKESVSFQEGYRTVRQVGFATLDMAWHSISEPISLSSLEFEKTILESVELLPPIEGASISCSFAHIFQGGYSAAYYSYKWAEVLDADAFELFQEKGLFDSVTAMKFRALLSAGGTIHPMSLYKNFRGRSPSIDALLRRAGLTHITATNA